MNRVTHEKEIFEIGLKSILKVYIVWTSLFVPVMLFWPTILSDHL